MSALDTITLSSSYMTDYTRQKAAFQTAVFCAASLLKNGSPIQALGVLRDCMEKHDEDAARVLWPTPPALSVAEMAELIAGDEAAERREAAMELDAAETPSELPARTGGLGA
jgi:hypothetical protein